MSFILQINLKICKRNVGNTSKIDFNILFKRFKRLLRANNRFILKTLKSLLNRVKIVLKSIFYFYVFI